MGAVSSTCCCPGRQMEPDITIPVFTERVFSEENVFSAEQQGLTEVRQMFVELSRQTGTQGSKIQEMMDMIGVLHAELQQQREENQQLSALLHQGGELDGMNSCDYSSNNDFGVRLFGPVHDDPRDDQSNYSLLSLEPSDLNSQDVFRRQAQELPCLSSPIDAYRQLSPSRTSEIARAHAVMNAVAAALTNEDRATLRAHLAAPAVTYPPCEKLCALSIGHHGFAETADEEFKEGNQFAADAAAGLLGTCLGSIDKHEMPRLDDDSVPSTNSPRDCEGCCDGDEGNTSPWLPVQSTGSGDSRMRLDCSATPKSSRIDGAFRLPCSTPRDRAESLPWDHSAMDVQVSTRPKRGRSASP